MPTLRLTDRWIAHLKPHAAHVDYWDATLPTFGVRVSPKGTKTFVLKLHGGRRAIGRYHPDILPLARARAEARRLIAEKTLGRIRPGSISYDAAVRLFIEDKRRNRRTNTYEGYEWLLKRFRFGQITYIKAGDITPQLGRIKSPSTAGHALIALRIFFNWAIKRQYRETNPTLGISAHQSPRRTRVLTDDELRSIWSVCETHRRGLAADCNRSGSDRGVFNAALPAHYCAIVQLLILTGQRRGEIAALRTLWVADDIITLPAEATKNGHVHSLPLGTLASAFLAALTPNSEGLLFPARGRPYQPFNGWPKCKATLDRLSGVTAWVLHDIRRTFRTSLSRLAVAPYVAERLVNHVSAQSDMEQTYNLYTYLPQMRKAIELWEAHLASVLHPAITFLHAAE